MSDDLPQLDNPREPVFELCMLADRAEVVNGKLYVMGGLWSRLVVQDFQRALPISFALSIIVSPELVGEEYVVQVAVEDAESHQPIGVNLQVSFAVTDDSPTPENAIQRVVLAVPAALVKFPREGRYEAVARILGGQERRVPFFVIAVPASSAESPMQ